MQDRCVYVDANQDDLVDDGDYLYRQGETRNKISVKDYLQNLDKRGSHISDESFGAGQYSLTVKELKDYVAQMGICNQLSEESPITQDAQDVYDNTRTTDYNQSRQQLEELYPELAGILESFDAYQDARNAWITWHETTGDSDKTEMPVKKSPTRLAYKLIRLFDQSTHLREDAKNFLYQSNSLTAETEGYPYCVNTFNFYLEDIEAVESLDVPMLTRFTLDMRAAYNDVFTISELTTF